MDDVPKAIARIRDCVQKLSAGIGLEEVVIVVRVVGQSEQRAYVAYSPDLTQPFASDLGATLLDDTTLAGWNNLIHTVFRLCPETRVVIRAKSAYSQAVAQQYRHIPPVLDDMAQIIGVHARVIDSADESRLKKALANGGACLLKGGRQGVGSIAAASSFPHAEAAALVLEKTARVFWDAQVLGGAQSVNPIEAWLMHLVFKMKYSQMEFKATHRSEKDFARRIPEDEMAIRQDIVDAGLRMLDKNLVQGTWGNISVQLDDQFMLVTPSGMEYDRLSPYDIVRVDMHSLEYEGNLKPTSEKRIHAELLKKKADVRSVIHTHPVSGSVFAAARKPVLAPDQASKKLLGEDAAVARYGLPGSKRLAKAVLEAIGENRACIMENHGTLACGTSLDDALGKCEALEQLAESQIRTLLPINNESLS
ncbi:MAG: class II aldolase/adducin family protein [Propionibacteriaceae bacterium]|jgi:ribulose-5-phosphate 4-epimerase/fuculose-1-phosphate aldolase|nr:class II aldolase/adducin family protein [Propionibacteriaceae bacterium]